MMETEMVAQEEVPTETAMVTTMVEMEAMFHNQRSLFETKSEGLDMVSVKLQYVFWPLVNNEVYIDPYE